MGRANTQQTAPTTSGKGTRLSERRQDAKRSTAASKAGYHHGDLRAALIAAADSLIGEKGVEGFSLRAAARKAGVSPAAPAHHFSGARALLTEVAILAYARADDYIARAGRSPDVVADVRAVALAFVRFAVEHPGHFRLMFRNDLIDRSDKRLGAASRGPGTRLGRAVLAYRGNVEPALANFSDAADMLCGMAALHGLANLVVEEKAVGYFSGATVSNFMEEYLPRIIEHMYPSLSVRS